MLSPPCMARRLLSLVKILINGVVMQKRVLSLRDLTAKAGTPSEMAKAGKKIQLKLLKSFFQVLSFSLSDEVQSLQ